MTLIEIRDFQEEDRTFAIALSGETLRELQEMDSESLPLAFVRDAAEWFDVGLRDSWSRRSLFYVATVKHAPAGFIIAGPTNDPWKPHPGDRRIPQKVAEIYEIHVKLSRRRYGVGSALLAAAERELTDQGYTYVTLGHLARNVAAGQLYASKGYRPRWVSEEKKLGGSP
jgi:ribosomal protein S18 acetylase RimI-like enzyme